MDNTNAFIFRSEKTHAKRGDINAAVNIKKFALLETESHRYRAGTAR